MGAVYVTHPISKEATIREDHTTLLPSWELYPAALHRRRPMFYRMGNFHDDYT